MLKIWNDMDFLEKDLEDIIYEATDEQLSELFLDGKRFRQLRIGNYGISDLIFARKRYNYEWDHELRHPVISDVGIEIVICELKKDRICFKTFDQAIKYTKGISAHLSKKKFSKYFFTVLLMGKSVDRSGSFLFLPDLFNQDNEDENTVFNQSVRSVRIHTFSYGFDGIKFKNHSGYYIP